MYYSSVGTLYIYLGSPSASASESGYLRRGCPLQKIKSRKQLRVPSASATGPPPAPSTMTPTNRYHTPSHPGEQLLNPDIEHIEIPQQQQQPETWTVWVETYVNARIQHEVVPLREEILLLRDRVLALETQPAVASGPPSVRLQGKPASGVRWIPRVR